eukprot:TRINITY_DN1029_c0_g1_i1.p1 TRINITY_DN1029_c0_g1~~TRINITY_DN1029_c0_g1_i1.p1  ORF type:complete len:495 (+),score=53.33 TRINITY_DN1029_c0_g1_i1:86-1486(+)
MVLFSPSLLGCLSVIVLLLLPAMALDFNSVPVNAHHMENSRVLVIHGCFSPTSDDGYYDQLCAVTLNFANESKPIVETAVPITLKRPMFLLDEISSIYSAKEDRALIALPGADFNRLNLHYCTSGVCFGTERQAITSDNSPSENGVITHVQALLTSEGLPVFVYSIGAPTSEIFIQVLQCADFKCNKYTIQNIAKNPQVNSLALSAKLVSGTNQDEVLVVGYSGFTLNFTIVSCILPNCSLPAGSSILPTSVLVSQITVNKDNSAVVVGSNSAHTSFFDYSTKESTVFSAGTNIALNPYVATDVSDSGLTSVVSVRTGLPGEAGSLYLIMRACPTVDCSGNITSIVVDGSELTSNSPTQTGFVSLGATDTQTSLVFYSTLDKGKNVLNYVVSHMFESDAYQVGAFNLTAAFYSFEKPVEPLPDFVIPLIIGVSCGIGLSIGVGVFVYFRTSKKVDYTPIDTYPENY